MESGEEIFYLMSIRPRFARLLFAGRKKFELRRWFGVPVKPGSIVVLYVSGDVQSIVGEFTAGVVHDGSPDHIRAVTSGPGSGLSPDAYRYIRSATRALAIEVVAPRTYVRSVSLEEIRNIIPGWEPPRSFTVLKEGDPLLEAVIRPLRGLVGGASASF